ncbi:hypothetical protein CQW23_07191 [Capsicum baccatum]|uniref:Uncharacterized protein n=1 Tax=Capsicum baccatum TaxID=33114 RepID=A0A2G2X5N3_CAPBA|nr:hypothetical protein CQW23_07191 [Capsicum baccatum]
MGQLFLVALSNHRSSKSYSATKATKARYEESLFKGYAFGSNKLVGNVTKGGRSTDHDGVLNDEAQDRERPIDEELQANLDRRNDREVEGMSQEVLALNYLRILRKRIVRIIIRLQIIILC